MYISKEDLLKAEHEVLCRLIINGKEATYVVGEMEGILRLVDHLTKGDDS